MSITIQLDLPDSLLKEAKAKGLLESALMGELLATEPRPQKAAADLNLVLDQIRAQPGEPITEEEIAAVVKVARRERRAREAGR